MSYKGFFVADSNISLNLVQKYMDSVGEGVVVDVNEWLNKPVKEIMKAIKENPKASKAETSANPKATPVPTEYPSTAAPGERFTPAPSAPPEMNRNKKVKDSGKGKGGPNKSAKPDKTPVAKGFSGH